MKNWYDKYINVPFKSGGRSIDAADCWGLIRIILFQECGIDLPDYGEISTEDLKRIAQTMTVRKDDELWQDIKLGEQKAFDVVVMRRSGSRMVCHVGIMINDKQLIHVEKGTDSAIVSINDWTVRERIECIRRHTQIAKL